MFEVCLNVVLIRANIIRVYAWVVDPKHMFLIEDKTPNF